MIPANGLINVYEQWMMVTWNSSYHCSAGTFDKYEAMLLCLQAVMILTCHLLYKFLEQEDIVSLCQMVSMFRSVAMLSNPRITTDGKRYETKPKWILVPLFQWIAWLKVSPSLSIRGTLYWLAWKIHWLWRLPCRRSLGNPTITYEHEVEWLPILHRVYISWKR